MKKVYIQINIKQQTKYIKINILDNYLNKRLI
jgi:hypothetical protein